MTTRRHSVASSSGAACRHLGEGWEPFAADLRASRSLRSLCTRKALDTLRADSACRTRITLWSLRTSWPRCALWTDGALLTWRALRTDGADRTRRALRTDGALLAGCTLLTCRALRTCGADRTR